MGIPSLLGDNIWTQVFTICSLSTLIFLLYIVYSTISNLYLHPLSPIPDPFLWRASRLPYILSLIQGNLVIDIRKLHSHYGDIVRTASDEVSFAHEDVWHDVFTSVGGHKPFPRDPVFFKSPPGQAENLITTVDADTSMCMRQVIGPAFTDRAVAKQEPVLQTYVSLMMDKMREEIQKPENAHVGARMNVVDWMNWWTFDVIGMLALGESFDCLKETANHPWAVLIFNAIKVMALAAATQYFPGLDSLILKLFPASTRKIGSETTGTTICGILNCLVQNPHELAKLETEVRTIFEKEEDITLSALQQLPFLNAVVNEGLRICNPVSGGLLRIVPRGGATVCGHFLPEGTHIACNTIAMALSEHNFHHCLQFLPDRYLPSHLRPSEYTNDNRNILKPWGLGSRVCLGRSFGQAELRLVLARLVWNFDLQGAGGKGVNWFELKNYIVVQKEPIWVAIRERGKM
ncbi:putative cytochrome p450 protein [Botrytis fragariae]|uniref:Putative cytochrome p450 protein n=1 Tax=Botrytis fragariae TaxID=1964551 RepID=A0A8H6AT41_9HELO|nr:putative cytochrome p450 protein [Botrytis fragariae]KAF5873019.1 putative cytochrome p450 protein [Botrytis fragariae]